MSENLLDKVLLSPRAVEEYHKFAREVVKSGVLNDIKSPSEIPVYSFRSILSTSLSQYFLPPLPLGNLDFMVLQKPLQVLQVFTRYIYK